MQHFLSAAAQSARLTPAALVALASPPWTENVRELRNFVELVLVHHCGKTIRRDALGQLPRSATSPPVRPPTRLSETFLPPTLLFPDPAVPSLLAPDGVNLKQLLANRQRVYIRAALALYGGTIARCTRPLGLQRRILIEKMGQMQLERSADPHRSPAYGQLC